jgi:catechol 2,3-dioxygenase-like lactoylglutathione lyase family enzyme
MAEWEKQFGGINLTVGDLERSKTFYREVFGLPPQHEEEDLAVFRFKNMYVTWQHDPAHQAPAGEVPGLAQKGVGQFAIFVEDVDAVCAELDEHGITLISGPADRDWGMRFGQHIPQLELSTYAGRPVLNLVLGQVVTTAAAAATSSTTAAMSASVVRWFTMQARRAKAPWTLALDR